MTESTRPRIGPVVSPDDEQLALLAKAPTLPDGSTRAIFLTLLHHPVLLQRFNAFAGTFMRFGLLPATERELVILRVAARTGSRYEEAQHVPIAREAGVGAEAIAAALLQAGPGALDDRGQLLMDVTDELLSTGAIGDGHWEALTAHYDDAALLELLCLIGFYRMAADMLNVAGVLPEG